jgi:hypothetical protein
MEETGWQDTETILGGVRRWFRADAEGFLRASEEPPPKGYVRVGSGGFVGTSDLFLDYFRTPPHPIKDTTK